MQALAAPQIQTNFPLGFSWISTGTNRNTSQRNFFFFEKKEVNIYF